MQFNCYENRHYITNQVQTFTQRSCNWKLHKYSVIIISLLYQGLCTNAKPYCCKAKNSNAHRRLRSNTYPFLRTNVRRGRLKVLQVTKVVMKNGLVSPRERKNTCEVFIATATARIYRFVSLSPDEYQRETRRHVLNNWLLANESEWNLFVSNYLKQLSNNDNNRSQYMNVKSQ